jgi:hypothetical protein
MKTAVRRTNETLLGPRMRHSGVSRHVLSVFLSLIASAWANESLDVLVNAAASFSATINQQLEMVQSNPTEAEFVEKTVDYAESKAAYFKALCAELPELKNVLAGQRSPEQDVFAAALAVAGEERQKAADDGTLMLLKRFSRYPDVAKANLALERAQADERRFHHDYDGLDFMNRQPNSRRHRLNALSD